MSIRKIFDFKIDYRYNNSLMRWLMPACFFVFVLFFASRAQYPFENISFENAIVKARQENKILFIQVAAKNCDQCNLVASASFEKAILQKRLAAACVSLSVLPDQKLWETLQKKYNTRDGGVTLFMDANGTLIHRYNATSSNEKFYLDNINIALGKEKNGGIYRSLEKSYLDGNRDAGFLEAFLAARNNLGMESDSVLNEYASGLQTDSARSRRVLQFIARMAPALGSVADKVLRKNIELFNQVWLSLEQRERVAINNNIIRKSKQTAVASKDVNAAFRVATFAAGTYFDYSTAQKAYNQIMVEFYRDSKDTLEYLMYASNFYDTYYMTISVDSVKREDSLKIKRSISMTQGDTARLSPNGVTVRKGITFSPSTQIYTNQLSSAAKTFYNFTNDPVYLEKALEWAKRACDFFESAFAMDIYARLLFRLDKRDAAISWEQKAIDFQKKAAYPTKEWEDVLGRMKKGEKNID